MKNLSATDGILREWGARLFYPHPKRAKASAGGIAAAVVAWGASIGAAQMRAKIGAVVAPRAKQVMVKITGGGKGMKPLAAHMRYISRLGTPEAGGPGKSLELEDEQGNLISGKSGIESLRDDWRVAGSLIPNESHRKEAFNIMLSMPAGTPADIVRAAAGEFARETFAGHKYVFVLHEDTDSPHVHLAVRAERNDGVRLNPRPADLTKWRERFASRLQDRGIHAVATRAPVHGASRASQDIWRVKASQGGRERKPRPINREGAAANDSRSAAITAWHAIKSALTDSPSAQDRALAKDVERYVEQSFGRVPAGTKLDAVYPRPSDINKDFGR